MEHSIRSCFSIVTLLILVMNLNAQTSDFFPLKTGVEQHYSYFRELESYKSSIYGPEGHDDYWKDSGTVVYKYINSSVQNDTTIIWNIREILNIISMEWHLDSLGLRDTTFSMMIDSSDYTLYEYTTGFHKLFANMFAIKLYGDMYRFYDTSNDSIVCNITDGYGYLIPNTFKKNVGLSNMFWQSTSYGNFSYFKIKKELKLLSIITAVDKGDILITNFVLNQNYPNPFNPKTTITYSLPYSAYVQLDIFNPLGQTIFRIDKKMEYIGQHTITWNASGLSSGVYILRLIVNGKAHSRKMLLLK